MQERSELNITKSDGMTKTHHGGTTVTATARASAQAREQRASRRAAELQTAARVQSDWTGCRTGNGEKLSSSQAEPGQDIKSAVA